MTDHWKRACELIREIWPEEKMYFVKAQADKAVDEFLTILVSDISLFLEKNEERGAEYEADGVVGAYFAIREIFVRLHHLVFDRFYKGKELDWDSKEGKELVNLFQDIRVTAMLGQIGFNHRNWCGNPEYLEAVLNLKLRKETE